MKGGQKFSQRPQTILRLVLHAHTSLFKIGTKCTDEILGKCSLYDYFHPITKPKTRPSWGQHKTACSADRAWVTPSMTAALSFFAPG
jgi:hypothetical protein